MAFIGIDELTQKLTALADLCLGSRTSKVRRLALQPESTIEPWAFPLDRNDNSTGDLFNVDGVVEQLQENDLFLSSVLTIMTQQCDFLGLALLTGQYSSTKTFTQAAERRLQRVVEAAVLWGFPKLFSQLHKSVDDGVNKGSLPPSIGLQLSSVGVPDPNHASVDFITFEMALRSSLKDLVEFDCRPTMGIILPPPEYFDDDDDETSPGPRVRSNVPWGKRSDSPWYWPPSDPK